MPTRLPPFVSSKLALYSREFGHGCLQVFKVAGTIGGQDPALSRPKVPAPPSHLYIFLWVARHLNMYWFWETWCINCLVQRLLGLSAWPGVGTGWFAYSLLPVIKCFIHSIVDVSIKLVLSLTSLHGTAVGRGSMVGWQGLITCVRSVSSSV